MEGQSEKVLEPWGLLQAEFFLELVLESLWNRLHSLYCFIRVFMAAAATHSHFDVGRFKRASSMKECGKQNRSHVWVQLNCLPQPRYASAWSFVWMPLGFSCEIDDYWNANRIQQTDWFLNPCQNCLLEAVGGMKNNLKHFTNFILS